MTLNHLSKLIKKKDIKYLLSINQNAVLFILIAFILIWLVIIILFICFILQFESQICAFKPMTNVFFGKKNTKSMSHSDCMDNVAKIFENPSLLPTMVCSDTQKQSSNNSPTQHDTLCWCYPLDVSH